MIHILLLTFSSLLFKKKIKVVFQGYNNNNMFLCFVFSLMIESILVTCNTASLVNLYSFPNFNHLFNKQDNLPMFAKVS